jgi:nitrogenase molybdenum-iron protein NifN
LTSPHPRYPKKNAIYGGGPNLKMGLTNVAKKYRPAMIGIAITFLTETIGDDVPMYLREYARDTERSEGEHSIKVG